LMLDQIKDHETSFRLEEATIADLHEAIAARKTTLVEVVERYIDRARAYNGIACLLLTEDGASDRDGEGIDDPAGPGQVQGGAA
jgi:amidase